MRKLSFILLGGFIVFQACNTTTTKVETADSLNNKDAQVMVQAPDTAIKAVPNTSNTDEVSADFALKAAKGGMMEVELGRWAQQHSGNASIKDFGAMMVTDHSAAGNELRSIASTKNISLPAVPEGDVKLHIDNMKEKKGAYFDRAYVDMMIEDHDKDVAEFEKAANSLADQDLKNFAAKTLPTLKKHQAAIKAIKAKM
jgi:putative membrane protein